MDVHVSAADTPSMSAQEASKTSGNETRTRVPSPHPALPKYGRHTVATLLSDNIDLGRLRLFV